MKFDTRDLTPSQHKTMHCLLQLQFGGKVVKALSYLRKYIGFGSKTTLTSALDSLEELGWIEIIRATPNPVSKEMNIYKILCPLDIFNIMSINQREFDEAKWNDSNFFDNSVS